MIFEKSSIALFYLQTEILVADVVAFIVDWFKTNLSRWCCARIEADILLEQVRAIVYRR